MPGSIIFGVATVVSKFDRVLVVCVGNICRSPTAEFLLQQALPGKQIESAGLAAVTGADMEPLARQVAEAHGLPCPPHRARQLTRELCRQADIILVMEARHRDGVAQLCPEARGKTFLLDAAQPACDIADPYRCPPAVFERVYQQIAAGCQAWAGRLAR